MNNLHKSDYQIDTINSYWQIPGHELDRFMENSSNQNLRVQFYPNSGHEMNPFLEKSSNFRILGYDQADFWKSHPK